MKFAFCLIPLTLFSLEREPWFKNPWEFQLDTAFTYSRYHHFSNAVKPLKAPVNDKLFYADVSVGTNSNWGADMDLELADTPRRPGWGFQSSALQYRMLWLDDVIGDPVSLMTGISARGVNSTSVRDVNSPYHSYFNGELNLAIGKELIEDAPYWKLRTYVYGAVGMANRGSPWARAAYYLQYNQQDYWQLRLFADSYFGFGNKNEVNIDHFHGYANIRHRSIDIGAAYRYLFEFWGSLSLEYAYRVYAHSYPEHVNAVTLRYILPFSPF